MNLNNIIIKLLIKFPAFGQVIQNVSILETKFIPTAATQGTMILYNKEFMDKLTEDEQVFIFAHEIMHICANHITRGEDKNREIWNIATDGVINSWLKYHCKLPLPKGGIDMPNAMDSSADEIYEALLKKAKNNNSNNQGSSSQGNSDQGRSGSGSGDQSEDNDNEQKGSVSSSGNQSQDKENEQEGSGGSSDEQSQDKDNEQNNDYDYEGGTLDDHDIWDEEKRKQLEEELDKLSDEEKNKIKEQEKKLKEELDKIDDLKKQMEENDKQIEENNKRAQDRRASRKRGSGASNSGIKLKRNKLGVTNEVPWQRLLDDMVSSSGYYDYSTPKQVKYGIVFDSWKVLPSIEVEVAIDVSGSVSHELVKNFLMECKGIFEEYESRLEMKVGFFDTSFYAYTENGELERSIGQNTKVITDANQIDEIDIPGGGGTDFEVALQGFSKSDSNKIVFTDGYADWENLPEMDVLWIVYGENPPEINPPGAKGVIYIKGEQFEKLNQTNYCLRRSK